MLAIIDYHAGNLTSVRRALEYLDIPCVVTNDAGIIAESQGILFPGVGAAGSAMRELRLLGLDTVLARELAAGKPLLGICLGSQILLEHCAENGTPTLGFLPGRSLRFDPALEDQGAPLLVPHMGWNTVELQRECRLFTGISPESAFYFVHSYYTCPAAETVLGVTRYGLDFCSVHGREGLWAVQFHPEKSGRPGLQLLQNFSIYCQEKVNAH